METDITKPGVPKDDDPTSLRNWLDRIELFTNPALEPIQTDPVSLRSGELLRQVFLYLWNRDEGASTGEILTYLSNSIALTEAELAPYPGLPSLSNYEIDLRSAMTAVARAGWLVKDKGRWHLSEEGRLVCKDFSSAEDFFLESQKHYQDWLSNRPTYQITFETAQDLSRSQIWNFLQKLPQQTFRTLVKKLIEAMNYHVAWVAPMSKERGFVDLIAYPDPLGVKPPRMIIYIKHNKQAMSVDNLTAPISSLAAEDALLVVASGGFTQDAKELVATQSQGKVLLIDLDKFCDLWIDNYDRLDQEARLNFPLRAIHFLDPGE